jgi:hypothetical protein
MFIERPAAEIEPSRAMRSSFLVEVDADAEVRHASS